jgi:hypothetical protein
MSGKRWGLLLGLVLLVGLCAAPAANAGYFIGYWGWHWNPAPDCPHPMYPPKHYWCVGYYKLRAWCNPSYLDQYPPGPSPAPPILSGVMASPCRTQPPAPTEPYALPQGYFGRSTTVGGLLVPMVSP